jgi:hypothetical protein
LQSHCCSWPVIRSDGSHNPWRAGFVMVFFGIVVVALAILLGG